jgi:hypothetical protein
MRKARAGAADRPLGLELLKRATEQNMTYQNEPIIILDEDADPSCLVWISFLNDPDRDAFVNASEIVR